MPQRIDEIEPGFFRLRHVRNGPWIAARVELVGGLVRLTQDAKPPSCECSTAEYADLVVAAVIEGEAFSHPIIRCLWFGVRIAEAEYQHMLRVAAWARANAPAHPLANPGKPVDINVIPIRDLF